MHNRQLSSGFRDFNVGLIICLHTFCRCTGSKGSDEAAPMLRRIWAFTERICHMYAHFVHVREQWRLRRVWAFTDRICHMNAHFVHVWEQWRHWQDSMHVTSSLRIGWKNMSYIRPFMCMFESSEGSDKPACMLLLVWALAERICHIYAHLCACARAVKDLVRLHVRSGVYEHSLMEYAICTPILCMCESSEGSGETARMLMLVWALTDRICHINTHFVHVREQWRLWRDCTHAYAS